jgi:DNA adenine methylase/adenine-specific DNA-methyltransferase
MSRVGDRQRGEAMKASKRPASLVRAPLPEQVRQFPTIRFMGSKARLLPWIQDILSGLEFDSALDAFSGSGCVAYLLKAMGKRVRTNDALNFCAVLATATVENAGIRLTEDDLARLLAHDPAHPRFIARTFAGIFFTPADLAFLDRVRGNLPKLGDRHKEAVALAALVRSCAKRQPRGVFTVAGDPERYKDGRRDLQLSLRDHFLEHVAAYHRAAFDNGRANAATRGDVFDADPAGVDLVYMDPPYVPRSDDNCYMKRYHFLEGLSTYWREGEILAGSRVKKLKKPYTPFSYRRTAPDAFDRLFARFSRSILVLSYSSNGYPDLPALIEMMRRYKRSVQVHETSHRYHFGTHAAAGRNRVREYLIVGT